MNINETVIKLKQYKCHQNFKLMFCLPHWFCPWSLKTHLAEKETELIMVQEIICISFLAHVSANVVSICVLSGPLSIYVKWEGCCKFVAWSWSSEEKQKCVSVWLKMIWKCSLIIGFHAVSTVGLRCPLGYISCIIIIVFFIIALSFSIR